jgi:hypothetical protein
MIPTVIFQMASMRANRTAVSLVSTGVTYQGSVSALRRWAAATLSAWQVAEYPIGIDRKL